MDGPSVESLSYFNYSTDLRDGSDTIESILMVKKMAKIHPFSLFHIHIFVMSETFFSDKSK